MLPPSNEVLIARQGFVDAQRAMFGALTVMGFFTVGWYGTTVSDERGGFALVNPQGPLMGFVGDFVRVTYKRRSVSVYVIGSYVDLGTDLAITRRSYMAIGLLAIEPVRAKLEVVL